MENLNQHGREIKIVLPDGKIIGGRAFITTPFDIGNSISVGLMQTVSMAKVNDELWDLLRPLQTDCRLELLK